MPVETMWEASRRSVEHHAMLISCNCHAEFAGMINEAAERLWFQDAPGDHSMLSLRQLQAIYALGLIALIAHADCAVRLTPAARHQVLDVLKRHVNLPLPRSAEEAATVQADRIAVAATINSVCRSLSPPQ